MHTLGVLCSGRRRAVCPQRVQGIVGQHTPPHQAPESVERFAGIAAAGGLLNLLKERSSMRLQERNDRRLPLLHFCSLFPDPCSLRHRPQRFQLLRQIQPNPSVALANRVEADPVHLARRNQGVEIGGAIAADARGKNLRLQNGRGQRRALQVLDRVQQGIQAAPGLDDALPARDQPGEHGLLDWLNLLPKPCERFPANSPQHLRIAPLAMHAARAKTALDDAPQAHQALQRRVHAGQRQTEAGSTFLRREWAVGAGIAAQQVERRLRRRSQERGGKPGRKRHAERIAVARGVLHGDQPSLAGHCNLQHALRVYQLCGQRLRVLRGNPAAQRFARQVAEAEEQVVHGIQVARLVALGERLQLLFRHFDRVQVEQLAQVGVAHQFAKLVLVDRQRLRAALGQRRIAVVDVIGDVAKQQRGREWRRRLRVDGGHAQRAAGDVTQHLQQRRHVEDIAQTLAIGFEQDGKAGVAAGHGQQIVGALALQPQRRAAVCPPARQQQGAGGALTELCRKQRGRAELPLHQLRRLGRRQQQRAHVRRSVRLGKAQHEAVLAAHGFHVRASVGADLCRRRHRPGRVDPAAEWSEDADAPVAQFIADALDDDVAVVGNDGGCDLLVRQILHQVLRGSGLQVVGFDQGGDPDRPRHLAQLTHQGPDAPAKLHRASGAVSVPERHLAGIARGGHDQNAVVGNLFDAPGRSAQDEGLAGLALVDILLVEFADPHRLGALAGKEDAIESAIGDGAAVQNCDPLGAAARREPVAGAVPGDAGTKLGELVGWIEAGEHVEHASEDLGAQSGERRGAADQREQGSTRDAGAGIVL